MRRLLYCFCLCFLAAPALAQVHVTEAMLEGRDLQGHCRVVDNAPSGACTLTDEPQCRAYQTGDSLLFYTCQASAWTITDMVIGPTSSTDNCIARFDSTTGKVLQQGTNCPTYDDSGYIVLGNEGQLRLSEATGSGTDYVALRGTAMAASYVMTLPAAAAGAAGYAMLSTGANATLSFADVLVPTELDTFAELNALVADKTLVNEEDAATFDAVITFGAEIVVFGDSAEGTCDAAAHKKLKIVAGGAGVADQLLCCMKGIDNAYEWIVVADGGD